MCIHSYYSPASSDVLDSTEADQKAWSILARMSDGTEQRFSAGVGRREDGRLVVSLLNHDPRHSAVGIVQWLGSDDTEDPSYDLDYAVAFAERVVSEYQKPVTTEGLLAALFGSQPSFFQRADAAYPGFEPVDPDAGGEPTPEGFGEA